MPREKKCEPGAPKWLVTFADLMSLLVCFFVLIISFSIPRTEIIKQISGSFKDAFGIQYDRIVDGLIELQSDPFRDQIKQVTLSPLPQITVEKRTNEDGENADKDEGIPQVRGVDAGDVGQGRGVYKEGNKRGDGGKEGSSIGFESGTGGNIGSENNPTPALDDGTKGANSSVFEQTQVSPREKAQTSKDADQEVEKVQEAIEEKLALSPELRGLAASVRVDHTPDGLRIQILDQDNFSMFPYGSPQPYDQTVTLLQLVAESLGDTNQKVAISGHTEAAELPPEFGYTNWELSAQRGNSARRILTQAGLNANRIQRVEGRAGAAPIEPENPNSSRNNRISITLLTPEAAEIGLLR